MVDDRTTGDMTHEEWEAHVEKTRQKLRRALVVEAEREEAWNTSKTMLRFATAAVVRARKARGVSRRDLSARSAEYKRALALTEALTTAYALLLKNEPSKPVDPPVFNNPGDQALSDYIDSLPFKHLMPAFPYYDIPVEEDCDWIISDQHAVSKRGLVEYHGPTPMAKAYELSRIAEHEGTITFGVRGDIGYQMIGFGYGHSNGTLHFESAPDVFDDINVSIVGLDAAAEMQMTLGDKFGFVDSIECYNIGFRGGGGNFIVSTIGHNDLAQGDIGDVLFDGCWWLNRASWVEGEYAPHTSGLHLGDHRSLIFRRHKFHGFRGREHCLYDKSSLVGPTWIVQNDMRGGNRTWFQRRPQEDHNERPTGDYCVFLNHGDSYGWDHGDHPSTFAGGSAMTVWTAPDHTVFIAGNKVIDSKYGCLMIGAQGDERDWFVEDENGADLPFALKNVYVWDNVFDNGQLGHPSGLPRRGAVSLCATQLMVLGPNEFLNGSSLAIPNSWAMMMHGMTNGETQLVDEQYRTMDIKTVEPGTEDVRLMTQAEKDALIVAEPTFAPATSG